ncbi:tetratricopeptide repeat protein 32-like [Littorina saxatilis]|uniref:Tetratricopeptide repeat protein n=1 Tax=Littorina saxatilis TaxID=31220 RepID=A0AAN9ARY7_9CAEN
MNFEMFEKAEGLEKEGKKEEAIKAYTDFITQCCSCYEKEVELPEVLEQTRARKEKLALAYNNRGFLYYLKVEFKLAAQDYTHALNYNPNMAVAYYNRGLIHYRLSRFSEAVVDLKEAVKLKPDLEPAHMCLQQALKDFEQRSVVQQ